MLSPCALINCYQYLVVLILQYLVVVQGEMKAVFLGMRLDFAQGPETESLEILAEKAFDAVVFNNLEGDKHEIPDLLVGRHIKTIQNFILLVQFSSYMFY